MNPLKQALSSIDQSQESITSTRRLVFQQGVDPSHAIHLMSTEFKSHAPYQRRLAIFYLFNDVLQYAARGNMTQYLERGTVDFIPTVSSVLDRFSDKEKQPFIRVLAIWSERHVLSNNYLEKLKAQWERTQPQDPAAIQEVKSQSTHRPHMKRLLHGDPKLVDPQEVTNRLQVQTKITSRTANEIKNSIPQSDTSFLPISAGDIHSHQEVSLRSLKATLSAEISDLVSLLVAVKASTLEQSTSSQ